MVGGAQTYPLPATIQKSYIFISFQQITFKLGIFTNLRGCLAMEGSILHSLQKLNPKLATSFPLVILGLTSLSFDILLIDIIGHGELTGELRPIGN